MVYGSVSSSGSIGESGKPSKTGVRVAFLGLLLFLVFLLLLALPLFFEPPDLLLVALDALLLRDMFLNPNVAESIAVLLENAPAFLLPAEIFLSMLNLIENHCGMQRGLKKRESLSLCAAAQKKKKKKVTAC